MNKYFQHSNKTKPSSIQVYFYICKHTYVIYVAQNYM